MGAYLSSPNCKKSSLDIADNERYSCAVSSMQGWRMNMEDAFSCSPDVDDNTGLFAVYDGHGGADVAIYCACHLSDMLKSSDEYKSGNYEDALRKTFMDIDKVLLDPKTAVELKFLSKRDPSDPPPTEEDLRKLEEEENEATEEAKLLCEEATMDIVEVLKRYGAAMNAEEDEHIEVEKLDQNCGSSKDDGAKESKDDNKTSTEKETTKTETSSGSSKEIKPDTTANDTKATKSESTEEKEEKPAVADEPKSSETSNTSGGSTKEVKPKFKKVKLKPQKKTPIEEDESDDEDYTGFESDEAIEGSDDEDDEEIESESEEDSEDEDEEIHTMADNGEGDPADGMGSMTDIPGSDSGTTAVVALVRGKDLYVANAGDSRAVICRKDGKTEDMSFDHKPEDEKELDRITKAGGRVNAQGRVNGGLNLSRAIGDHFYKKNKDLSLEDQMITAMPDIKKITLDEGDEFMVLACDGIWNVMSSEEVVKFVRDRLNGTPAEEGKNGDDKVTENGDSNGTKDENGEQKCEKPDKLSTICEQLFDHCLAPDTLGDGTGCDNMTCLIVQFNKTWLATDSNSLDSVPVRKHVTSGGDVISDGGGDVQSNGTDIVTKRPRSSPQKDEESLSKRTKAEV